MKPALPALWTLAVLLPLPALAAPGTDKQAVKEFALPQEKDAVVIRFDVLGGLTVPRISAEPIMSILADGRVKIPACYKGQKPFEGKISPAELQELLRFAIDQQKFFEHDIKKIEEKLAKRENVIPPPTDSVTTTIRIHAGGREHEASYSGYNPRTDPEEFKRLAALHQRLEQVKAVVQMGGKEKIAEYLKDANARLKESYPEVSPLGLEHFTQAAQRNDGSRSVEFRRVVKDAQGKQVSQTDVSIYVPAGGEARIQAHHAADAKP